MSRPTPSTSRSLHRRSSRSVPATLTALVLLAASVVKRTAGYADPVFVVGSLHGVLFVLFAACVAEVTLRRPWWSVRFWLYAAAASVVPGGTFVLDRWLARREKKQI